MNAEIVMIAETSAQVDEAIVRLARVGIENVKGFLLGDDDDWTRESLPVENIKQVSVSELQKRIGDRNFQLVDVRRPGEYAAGHIPGARHSTLANIEQHFAELPFDKSAETAVVCAGGYRSSAAASLLQKHGYTNLVNVTGGTNAWVNAGYPLEK